MFFRSTVMLYKGELHIFCNCKKKVVFELFVLRLACSHSLAKMEKSKDVCLSMPLNGDSDKFMMVCRKLAKRMISNSVFLHCDFFFSSRMTSSGSSQLSHQWLN